MTIHFSVRNFDKFQHYKDRSPPWIKLYNELLDDYAFARLQDASKLHLILIWLLASRSDNKLPYDAEWISRRINATEPVNLDALVEAGFLLTDQPLQRVEQIASTPLATCPPEREAEAEGEKKVSVAKATAAVAAPEPEGDLMEIPLWLVRPENGDASAAVYRQGLAWLAKAEGTTPKAQRSFLGKLLRDTGDDHATVWALMQRAARENIVDPKAWLVAQLGGKADEFETTLAKYRALAEAEKQAVQ